MDRRRKWAPSSPCFEGPLRSSNPREASEVGEESGEESEMEMEFAVKVGAPDAGRLENGISAAGAGEGIQG